MSLTGEQIKSLTTLQAEEKDLYQLMTSPGWESFVAEMKKSEDFAYTEMVSAKDAATMGRNVGAYHVAKAAQAFPARKLKEVRFKIQAIENQGANPLPQR